MQKRSNSIFFYMILAINFMVILCFNIFTPLITDDFSFYTANNNFSNILKQFISSYLSWGGGFTSFLFTKTLLLFSKFLYNITNSLIYTGIILLIYYLVTGSFSVLNTSLLLVIVSLLWFIPPAWGQDFLWTNGSTAYSWTTLLILCLCAILRKEKKFKNLAYKFLFSLFSLVLSILCGWSIANYGVSITVFVIALIVSKKFILKSKIQIFEIISLIGTFLGTTALILAPGNYVRMSAFTDTRPFPIKLASRFINITLNTIETFHILIPVFIALVAYMIITKQYKKLITPGIYFISFLAAFYSMIMSPTFPDRAMLLGIVFFIISLLQLYNEVEKTINFKKLETIAVLSFSILVFPVSLYKAARNIYHFNAGWKQRIAYINEQKEKGNLNVTVPIIKLINPHVAGYDLIDLSKDPNDFPNPAIAEYFGLESITGYEE